MDLAVDTARFIPLRTPLLKLFPTAFPELLAFPSAFENCFTSVLTADFALLPNASSPEFTTFTLARILVSELCALLALPAIDFILELTDFNATTIASVPAAPPASRQTHAAAGILPVQSGCHLSGIPAPQRCTSSASAPHRRQCSSRPPLCGTL